MADKGIITKIKDKTKQISRELAFQLAAGMQKVNNEAFSGYGQNVTDGHDLTVNQQAECNRVAKALLQGEQTQAVKELAYRTALIEEEAKDFEYLSESLALRYENKYYNVKTANIDTNDGRKVLFVQKNHVSSQSIASSFKEIGMNVAKTEDVNDKMNDTAEEIETEGGDKRQILDIGKVKLKGEHRIEVKTNTVTKFQIGSKLEQVVVKEGNDGKRVIDFYFSRYPNPTDWTSKPFVKELERIINQGWKSSILDIATIGFITSCANGVKDNLKFGFKIDRYMSCSVYEGWYILTFEATAVIDGEDIMAPLYCESMAEKYRKKAPKEYVMHISPHTFNRTYVCEECGKTVQLDLAKLESMEASAAQSEDLNRESDTDLDENGEFKGKTDNLSYYDVEIIEQTFGKRLCRECFDKMMGKMSSKTMEMLANKEINKLK